MLALVAVLAAAGAWLYVHRSELPGLPRSHLANVGSNGRSLIVIWSDPPGGPEAFAFGAAEPGEPCDVLESVTALGTKWSRVRVRARDLRVLPRARLAFLDDNRTRETDPVGFAELDAAPVIELVGWTRWVAE